MATTYKRLHLREAMLPWPPEVGSRAKRDTKFTFARDNAIPLDAASASATLYETASRGVAPEDYRLPEKRLGLQILPMDKPTASGSDYTSSFVSYGAVPARLRRVTPEALEAAFASLDARGEGFVLLAELPALLTSAYATSGIEGGGPEELVVTTLTNVYRREPACPRAADGRHLVSLQHLLEGVDAVAGMLEEDLALGRPEVLSKTGSLREKDAASRSRGISPAATHVVQSGSPRSILSASGTRGGATGGVSAGAGAGAGMGADAEGEELVGAEEEAAASLTPRATPRSPAAALRSPNQRSAPLGESLSIGPGGLLSLAASPGAQTRLFTAGPLGLGTDGGSSGSVGLKLMAIREATLAGERALASGGASGRSDAGSSPRPFELAGPAMATSNVRDLGDFGSNPRDFPLVGAHVAGHPTTLAELAGGTTRVAMHPPGYTGHISEARHGAALAHSTGEGVRDSYLAHTNKADTFFPRVPGYTGHTPRFVVFASPVVDKPHGVTALTTHDAAY